MSKLDLAAAIHDIKTSGNYQATAEATVRLIAEQEAQHAKTQKALVKAIRTRLHHIMAPYLGDPDYPAALAALRAAYATADPAEIQRVCRDLLAQHDSTAERLPILDRFYADIFAITGPPTTLLDLACALNPLTLPWMPAPRPTTFHAYDIHEPRVAFLNAFFELNGLPATAHLLDLALHAPPHVGDVALFLKEIPRFDKHYGGLSRNLLTATRTRWWVLSFPAVSLHGGRSLVKHYRAYFERLISGLPWIYHELAYDSELVFVVDTHTQ